MGEALPKVRISVVRRADRSPLSVYGEVMSDPFSTEDVRRMIDMVNRQADKELTAWEQQFMESITDQFDRSGTLSVRQLEILERIYAEKTP